MNYRCIVFDYGGTLTHRDGAGQPEPAPLFTGRVLAEFLESKGRGKFDPAQLEQIAAEVNAALPAAGQTDRRAIAHRLVTWAQGIYGRIGCGHPLLSECEELAARYRWRSLQRDSEIPAANRRTLEELAGRGHHLAVLSNNDGYLEDRLILAGMRPLFACVVDSAWEGVAKPDPAIFRIAERRLSARAEDCLYVGDDFDKDVKGAQAAGWHVAYLLPRDSVSPHDPRPEWVIRSLVELLEQLQ